MRRRTFISLSATAGLAVTTQNGMAAPTKSGDIPKRVFGKTGAQVTIIGQAGGRFPQCTFEEAKAQLTSKGMDDKKADFIAPHRVFTGNRPSITFVYDKLTPFALGRLIALYEHRVFVEGVLFRINSFDQWGVELGKELATGLLPVIEGKESAAGHDSSTQGLVAALASRAK